MGIFENKIKQKQQELNRLNIRLSGWNDWSNTQKTFSLLNQVINTKLKQVLEIDEKITADISKLPSHYNLAPLQTLLNDIKVHFHELQNAYAQGQEGNSPLKLSNLNVTLAALEVPPPVITIVQEVKTLFNLMKDLRGQAQEAFRLSSTLGDSDEERKLKWEASYLSNITYQYLQNIANLHNDSNFWVQEAPKAKPKAKPDPLDLFKDEEGGSGTTDVDHLKEFKDLPDMNPKEPASQGPSAGGVLPKQGPSVDIPKAVPPIQPQNTSTPPPSKPQAPPPTTDIKPKEPKEVLKFDKSNSKLTPIQPSSMTEARGFSFREPPNINPKFILGAIVQIGFAKYKIVGYKRGELHKISYIVTGTNGEYYQFEPYNVGIKKFSPNFGDK